MKYIMIFLVVICAFSCSSVRVNYDYDKSVNFADYSTYNYYPEIQTGLTDLDSKRLYNAIDSTMQLRGILLAEEPDFYINIQSSSYVKPNNSTVGVGIGGTGGNVGGGVSIGVPIGGANLERELIFDLVDSQKDALIWQAVSLSNFSENNSPNTRERKLYEIVAKVFSKYPPVPKNTKKK
ncbi:DUF4136 domain-containing protein [uncultured Eudoraea sp.]|uniref:DUF4136 domain-containing protein n=1 Tax=uncultured Eudoraea sp. TaxID=1035614 RepID=UPI00261EF30A|nr:DUF4136 domain-containing protein [uncultured Eudoraea sp.]